MTGRMITYPTFTGYVLVDPLNHGKIVGEVAYFNKASADKAAKQSHLVVVAAKITPTSASLPAPPHPLPNPIPEPGPGNPTE